VKIASKEVNGDESDRLETVREVLRDLCAGKEGKELRIIRLD
jgi:hypothetical protein